MSLHPHSNSSKRRRHLDRGEGHDGLHGAAGEDAAERQEARRRRRVFCRLGAREQPGEESQVVERPAVGGRGLPPTPVPIDVLVQRERVRHFADQVVAFAIIHPACLGSPPLGARGGIADRMAFRAEHELLSNQDVRESEAERAGSDLRYESGKTSLSRTNARFRAMRAASGLARRSMKASCR